MCIHTPHETTASLTRRCPGQPPIERNLVPLFFFVRLHIQFFLPCSLSSFYFAFSPRPVSRPSFSFPIFVFFFFFFRTFISSLLFVHLHPSLLSFQLAWPSLLLAGRRSESCCRSTSSMGTTSPLWPGPLWPPWRVGTRRSERTPSWSSWRRWTRTSPPLPEVCV